MKEIWKDIAGYEGLYQVSNLGRVKRLQTRSADKNGNPHYSPEIVLKPWDKHKGGYYLIGISMNNRREAKLIHRLVAEAFIPNPENKPQVNHIDGDKRNNKVDNLEWVTNAENQRHKIDVLGKKTPAESYHTRTVKCVELDRVFRSVSDASKFAGVPYPNITAVCRGYKSCHTAGGYHWEYAD